VNEWRIDYRQSKNFTFGGTWKEEMKGQSNVLSRVGGIDMTLFEASGSPLNLFYGIEEADVKDGRRQTMRYHIRFDQRPGPNQNFSFFVGNVSYHGAFGDQWRPNNWTMRLDYQYRF
jgi:hypothetical protein